MDVLPWAPTTGTICPFSQQGRSRGPLGAGRGLLLTQRPLDSDQGDRPAARLPALPVLAMLLTSAGLSGDAFLTAPHSAAWERGKFSFLCPAGGKESRQCGEADSDRLC